jgi:hypothetical protein
VHEILTRAVAHSIVKIIHLALMNQLLCQGILIEQIKFIFAVNELLEINNMYTKI